MLDSDQLLVFLGSLTVTLLRLGFSSADRPPGEEQGVELAAAQIVIGADSEGILGRIWLIVEEICEEEMPMRVGRRRHGGRCGMLLFAVGS